MKLTKFILVIMVSISISSLVLVGCSSSEIDIDKEAYTVEELSKIKRDLSKKISKSIKSSGLRVVENHNDGSFVLSLGNLELSKEQPKQVLHYSFNKDDKTNKEILDLHCVKDYGADEELLENDKFVEAIYNMFTSLANTELTYKDFFKSIKNVFDEGEGSVDLTNDKGISILINELDESTKTLELRFNHDFTLK